MYNIKTKSEQIRIPGSLPFGKKIHAKNCIILVFFYFLLMVVSKKSEKLNTHINERFSITNSKTFSFINKQEKNIFI